MRHPIRLAIVLVVALMLPLAWAPLAAQYDRVFDELIGEMEEIRQLALEEELDIRVISREEYIAEVESSSDSRTTDAEYEDYDRILVAFGFIEAGEQTKELNRQLYGSNVLGYYNPTTDEMVVIVDDPDEPLDAISRVTFAHEVLHALQDQNLPMADLVELRAEGTNDQFYAITALIEGDASLAEIDLLLGNGRLAREYLQALEVSTSPETSPDAFPPYLAQTLYFPYNNGLPFAQFLYEEGGWELINDAYDDPPMTSEQIMHPEKYLDGEAAIPVDLPDLAAALGPEWRTIEHNTHGEFVISIFLADSDLTESQVQAAHEGWGGDEFAALTNEDETAVAWVTEWDTEQDATEFFRAAVVRESGRLDAEVDRDAEGAVWLDADGTVVMLYQRGSRVTYLQGPDTESIEAMVAEIEEEAA